MPAYQYNQLQVPLDKVDQLQKYLSRALSIPPKMMIEVKPLRQSLDSRKQRKIQWVFNVGFTTEVDLKGKALSLVLPWDIEETPFDKMPPAFMALTKKIHIIGAGPCGMSAALHLARKGYEVEVIEMGAPVESRFKDIRHFLKQGKLNESSNILFGEGGAGAFSDGKLTCRTRTPFTEQVLIDWVEGGAPEDITWLSRPHIGTDQLQFIVKKLRDLVIEAGATFRFNSKFEDLRFNSEGLIDSILVDGNWEPCQNLMLAVGHSCRPLYRMLHSHKMAMEPKGYAVGFRIEHPQSLINDCQIGEDDALQYTGTAEYSLHAPEKNGQAGAYSFCMCPGGVLIPCAGADGELATNGMSYSRRNSPFSNAGIVVPIEFNDFNNPLEGMEFQRSIERHAYELGGGGYVAPAQRASSFMKGILDQELPKSSYPTGLKACELSSFYPRSVTKAIKKSMEYFDKKIPGFIEQGLLVAPETRTSSPLRILRDENTFESVNLKGVYPLGEGGGFAGGIISSAADGLHFASKVLPFGEIEKPIVVKPREFKPAEVKATKVETRNVDATKSEAIKVDTTKVENTKVQNSRFKPAVKKPITLTDAEIKQSEIKAALKKKIDKLGNKSNIKSNFTTDFKSDIQNEIPGKAPTGSNPWNKNFKPKGSN